MITTATVYRAPICALNCAGHLTDIEPIQNKDHYSHKQIRAQINLGEDR